MPTPKPTILILEGTERIGGGQRVTLEMVKSLSDDFTFIAAVPNDGPLEEAFQKLNVETHVLSYAAPRWKFGLLDRITYLPRGLASMPSVRRVASRADLVYATSRTGLWAAYSGRPAVMHLHLIPPSDRTSAYLRWLARRRGIRSVAVASSAISDAINLPAGSTHVIPNGVDTETFKPDPAARSQIRSALGLADSTFTVGIAAELAPDKGQLDAVQAISKLRNAGVDVTLVLAGSARRGQERYADELSRTAETLGISDHVRFLGHRTDMLSVMNAFDLLAVPSKGPSAEACPMSILEAWATGVPVVASNAGGLTELLTGDRGLTFTPGDTDALARAVQDVATDGALRDSLAAAGLGAARSDYSRDAFIARVRAFVNSALSG